MKYLKLFEEFKNEDIKIAHFFIDDVKNDRYGLNTPESDSIYFDFESFIKDNYPGNSLFMGIGPRTWASYRRRGNIFILFETEHFDKKYEDFVPLLGLANVSADGKVNMISWENNAYKTDDLQNILFNKNILDQKFKEYAGKNPEIVNDLVNYANPSWFRFEWKDSRYER
jgi:hypothetical protein